MAFTPWKTWSAGETLTAANFNQQIRDNGLAEGPHLIARKTSNQTVTSSTTLVNDTTLVLPLAANEIWQFQFSILYAASVTGNIKTAFTFPASGEIVARTVHENAAASLTGAVYTGTTTPTGSINYYGNGGTFKIYLDIPGVFINASTAGSLTFQFAQNTSDGTATTVFANSALWAVKLA